MNLEIIKYDFLEDMRRKNWSKHTIRGAYNIVQSFLKFVVERYGSLPLAEINRGIINEYHEHLFKHKTKAGKKLKYQSIVSSIFHVRRFFKFLVKTGIVLFDPTDHIRVKKELKKLPEKLLSVSDIFKVLDIPKTEDLIEGRDKAILELLYSSGIRRAEVSSVNIYDLDLEAGLLKVRGKGKKERMVPVGKTACSWLRNYLDRIRPEFMKVPGEQAFFLTNAGHRLNVETVALIVKKYMHLAELKGFSTHAIRHAFASHLLQAGCSIKYIQEMLGHNQLSTTQIYAHLRKEDLREALERYHPEGRKETSGSQGG